MDARLHSTMHAHEAWLSTLANVEGIGVGKKIVAGQRTDTDAIMVFVREKMPETELRPHDLIPYAIGAFETDVVYSDIFRAPPPSLATMLLTAQAPNPTEMHRPAPGGVSVGHPEVTAGTLTASFRHTATGRLCFLSNNHVLANSNAADIGDAAWQPARSDHGGDNFTLGHLGLFVPIVWDSGDCPIAGALCQGFNRTAAALGRSTRLGIRGLMPLAGNTVDCALAWPLNEADLRHDILVIGFPGTEPVEAVPGMAVQKFGRTTRHTTGSIVAVDTTLRVNYNGPVATFTKQIVASAMSAGGDSGSYIVTGGGDSGAIAIGPDNQPVGLLFAGSSELTIFNPIADVFAALGVEPIQ